MLHFSQADSGRFGLRIFRGTPDEWDMQSLMNEIEQYKPDIVILRLPSITKSTHASLYNLPWQIYHCDNLVYYQCSLGSAAAPLRNVLDFQEADDANVDVLNSLVPVVFKDYQNHYFSNPSLDRKKITEGYLEWARSYTKASPGRCSWLVYRENIPVAFATCSFDEKGHSCEGVLYGVHPDYAGKGIYSDLIRFTQQYFKERGFKIMVVSTQIQNYSVQKVWGKEGFTLKKAYDTYHINSFLSNPGRVQNTI